MKLYNLVCSVPYGLPQPAADRQCCKHCKCVVCSPSCVHSRPLFLVRSSKLICLKLTAVPNIEIPVEMGEKNRVSDLHC